MKNFILLLIFSVSLHFGFAQTGPAGIGNSTNNILWLDASSLGLANNALVSSWSDLSGNGNNAVQSLMSRQPQFKTNQVNSKASVQFNGSSNIMFFLNDIKDTAISIFMVSRNTTSSGIGSALTTRAHSLLFNQLGLSLPYLNPTSTSVKIAKTFNTYSINSILSSPGLSGASIQLTNGSTVSNYLRNDPYVYTDTTTLGGRFYTGSYNRFFSGNIAELIIYNERLNTAERNIINSFLGVRYGLTPTSNIYSFGTSFGHGIKGIGQESDGNNLSARGNDSLMISNASNLNDGEYLMIGHNDAGYGISTSVSNLVTERWNQVWRADVTGSPGTVDVEFFLGTSGFASINDYVLLIERIDGDFSNGGTIIHETGRTYSAVNNSISFTGVNFIDGDYFTLAEKEGDIISVKDGLWAATTTWNCGCIPVDTSLVTIENTHDVIVNSNVEVFNLTVASGGSLNFSGTDTLSIYNELIIEGTLNPGNGTIAAVRTSTVQEFDNNSGTEVAFYNLFVDNNSGLDLLGGVWSLSNNLQVSNGGLDVSGSDGLTLISNASTTSQILASMEDAFKGNYTIQRFISTRNANYANISSPVEEATIADLDDDLYLSGVNGDDGNATTSGGGTFYSVYAHYSRFGQDGKLTSTTEELFPGIGYEVYLADNLTTFNGKVIDFVGIPNVGSLTRPILTLTGWNLYGNPYHAHVAWDSVEKVSWVPTSYYIFNTDNGSYDFITGSNKPLIAPGQGFWINTTSPGKSVEIKEEDKVSSNSSGFLRKKSNQAFALGISSQINPFKHQMSVGFTPFSTDEMDELDALYLQSPIETAPAIYSKATNSQDGLIFNSLNSFEESQVIPIEIYAGLEGTYSIEAENVNELYKNYSCIYLKDKETNSAVDLAVEPTYQFETTVGNKDRFQLILSNSFVDCEKLIQEGSVEQKLDPKLSLRNAYNQWYIDYTLGEEQSQVEIHIYNVSGQEVVAPITFGASNAGTYPLPDLQSLNGIYVIQVRSKDSFINKTVKL